MKKVNIYDRMASSPMVRSHTYGRPGATMTIWIAQFEYANGLVTEFDGQSWTVVREERT